jgi:DNA-directed RNA polymerase subunit RPC12/RpoP
MPEKKCPHCGFKGELRGTEEFFERRGQWPDGHWPVRRCRNCGGGFLVRPRLFPPGLRTEAISGETWQRMEQLWEEQRF